jgi:hypothetical protein
MEAKQKMLALISPTMDDFRELCGYFQLRVLGLGYDGCPRGLFVAQHGNAGFWLLWAKDGTDLDDSIYVLAIDRSQGMPPIPAQGLSVMLVTSTQIDYVSRVTMHSTIRENFPRLEMRSIVCFSPDEQMYGFDQVMPIVVPLRAGWLKTYLEDFLLSLPQASSL